MYIKMKLGRYYREIYYETSYNTLYAINQNTRELLLTES